MYFEFKQKITVVMDEAGYQEIRVPADFSSFAHGRISLWAKFSGAYAYYYIVYDLDFIGTSSFDKHKAVVDYIIDELSKRNNMRHSVSFNMLLGDMSGGASGNAPGGASGDTSDNAPGDTSGDIRDIEKMINSPGEFGLLPKYDIYYGVDMVNGRVLRNSKQPDNMDGALDKIKAAMNKSGQGGKLNRKGDKSLKRVNKAAPVAKYPIFTYIIMAYNLIVFLLMEFDGGSQNVHILLRYGAVSYYHLFVAGEFHRLVMPIFLHIGWMHLFVNSMSLILFGIRAERYFGHFKFIAIYFFSGIIGNVAMAVFSQQAVGAGASGAIFGIIGALFAYIKLRKKNIENFNAAILGVMILVNVFMGFTMNNIPADIPGATNIGNAAHIGGLVAGLWLGYLLAGESKKK